MRIKTGVSLLADSKLIATRWKNLNAFITELYDTPLKCENCSGPLTDFTVAVKDNFCTKGVKTSCGSLTLDNFVSPYNATVVEKMLRAGAVVVGKTNMDEFAMGSTTFNSYYGPCINPWTYEKDSVIAEGDFYSAGGSSGGSAVAVATGMARVALGSDTGGSTINPGSRCGVVAFKPSYGVLSRHGLISLANSLDTPAILSNNVDDARSVYNVIRGRDDLDSTSCSSEAASDETLDPSTITIGIPQEFNVATLHPDVLRTWQHAADICSSIGSNLTTVSIPHMELGSSCYSVLSCCEIASNMSRFDGVEFGYRSGERSSTESLFAATRHDSFNDIVRARILAGNFFLLRENYDDYFVRAMRVRRLMKEDFRECFRKCDAILAPVATSPDITHSQFSSSDYLNCLDVDRFTIPANMAGLPSVAVPICRSACNTPISLQLIGRRFSDGFVLQLAEWLESKVDYKPGVFLSK